MRCYFFGRKSSTGKSKTDFQSIQTIFETIAAETDTRDLVVSCYFMQKSNWFGGSAYVRKWMQPGDFCTGRGKWGFTRQFQKPGNLPQQFKLIRLLLVEELVTRRFPLKLKDVYGWEFEYQNEESYLALLFAHELHHFRRYHLGLHPREGEKSANRWALEHVRKLGFQVSGRALKIKRKKRLVIARQILRNDPYNDFRGLVAGNQVYIRHDPRGRYGRKIAKVLRPIRANSKRIAIQTEDEKSWLWPMEWLEPINSK